MSGLQYAVHAYAWCASWSNKTLDLIDRTKRLGFDKIEVPLMEIELVDPVAIRKRLEQVGLGVCTSTACGMATDPTAEDAATRRQAVDYLKKCVEITAEMGATVFTGVTYSAIGRKINGRPTARQWEWAAKALKAAARHAQKYGVTIGIEPINRYETFLINTGEQGMKLMAMVDEPNVALHLDAYHMNIEENDFYTPTLQGAPHLCHYHLSESHRGTVGRGVVNWDDIFRALADGGYRGTVGMESFIEVSPAMAAATCIWRTLAESTDESLAEGLAYLKKLEKKHAARVASKTSGARKPAKLS
jgi:D-psicose/D-tagatose/L-ribulose 3-epimerase